MYHVARTSQFAINVLTIGPPHLDAFQPTDDFVALSSIFQPFHFDDNAVAALREAASWASTAPPSQV
jgi:hypothetical protein